MPVMHGWTVPAQGFINQNLPSVSHLRSVFAAFSSRSQEQRQVGQVCHRS